MQNVIRTSPKYSVDKNLGANVSSSGATELLAAKADIFYRVLAFAVIVTDAVNVKFQSASTDISATFPLGANGGLVLPFNEHGWFETAVDEALNVNLSTGSVSGVQLHYIEINA